MTGRFGERPMRAVRSIARSTVSLLCWFALSPEKATVETPDRTPAAKQSATNHAARAGIDEAAERTLKGD